MINRQAAGVGPWLLNGVGRTVSSSPEAHKALLERLSYSNWLENKAAGEADAGYTALLDILGEIWADELDGGERAVLRGLHLEGKNESRLAQEMGLHHSAVGRLRRRGEGKLRCSLGYVLRYRSLVEQYKVEQSNI